jgi:TonB family protein
MRMKLLVALWALIVIFAPCGRAQDQPAPASGAANPAPQQSDPVKNVTRIRVGGTVASSKIDHMVAPIYPPIAKTAHVSGTVLLHCIIAKDGRMLEVSFISGPPLLMKAAMDAVRQWTYHPTLLNGNPVEVETTISVVFALGQKPAGDPPKQEAPAAAPNTTESTPGTAANPDNSTSVTVNAASDTIDPQFAADVQRLMDLTHLKQKQEEVMRNMLDSMRPTLTASFPNTANREKIIDAYGNKLIGLVQSDDFKQKLITLYARYLTDDDVKAAIAFYETSAGQHVLESSMKLAPELMAAGQQIAVDNLSSIFQDLCKEFPELQGEAKFCVTEDSTRKSLLLAPNSFPAGN